MTLERDCYERLLQWKASPRRKPLLLRGARQVGKTWLLRALGQRAYSSCLYLNFEEDPRLAGLWEGALDPATILGNLALYKGVEVVPGDTLVVLDEIQFCNAALNSLKYFAEEAPEIHVAAAGSLLGIRLSGDRSFPVGKVDLVDVHPLSFAEFLDAHGEPQLRALIQGRETAEPLPDPLHERLLEILRTYLFVGGLPEPVCVHSEGGSLQEVREVQRSILESYHLDFAKHASPSDIPKLSLIWESLPSQLARENRKFMFSAVRPGARAREYENAVNWLVDAGLVHKAFQVSTARIPLLAYARTNVFKVYALDVGLLCSMTRLPESALVEGARILEEFRGALTESYVAQQLVARDGGRLCYWSSSGGRAEVDFLLEEAGAVLPLEVKAGVNPRSKSLRSFQQQFSPPVLTRASTLNLRRDGDVLNVPLYAVWRFPELVLDSSRDGDSPVSETGP